MSRKKTLSEFKEQVREVFGEKVEIVGEYNGNAHKVLVKYVDCGHFNYKIPSKLLAGQGCGQCKGKTMSRIKTKTLEQYKNDLLSNGIDYIEVISEYKGICEKIKVKNLKCGHESEARAGNILRGSGCPVCHGMKDTKKFEEQINTKYPNEYIILGEYVNNRKPIRVRHKCGYEWEVIPKDLMRSIRCPNCITSKGEMFIKDYLTKNNIEFIPEYIFPDCKDKNPLPFDFAIFINDETMLIEFDGVQHFRDERSMYSSEKVILHDKIKDEYCEKNKIKLLRVPYWWLRNDKIIKELNKFIFNK